MKAENLIGLTIKEAIQKIERAEANADTYQFYIVSLEHKTRNMKELYKRVHLHNEKGKRVYKIIEYDLRTYAKETEPQQDSFILDAKILKEYHDNWSFSGYVNTASHNVYYLHVDGIKKGNKAREVIENKKERLIEYKENELTKKQRRITL